MEKSVKAKTNNSSKSARRTTIDHRIIWVAAAALSIAFSAGIAFTQPPHPDAWRTRELFSLDWWLHPVERNAFRRLPIVNSMLHDLAVLRGGKVLLAVGYDGLILRSEDSGQSWQPIEITAKEEISSTPEAAEQITAQAPMQTVMPGNQYDAPISLHSVFFIDDATGWIAGDHGTILHTTDGGRSWKTQASRPKKSLSSIHFIDAKAGWAAGWDGEILHSRDGGLNWTAQTSGTEKNLSSIHFIDPQTGWATGLDGTILHTTDGGQSWTTQISGTERNLYSIRFIDTQTGWAAGWGVILHTTDGGQSWTAQVKAAQWGQNDFSSIYFIDAKTGWAAGEKGTILHTADGGQTWTRQASGIDALIRSVVFTDEQTGWATGLDGAILYTADSGQTWVKKTVEPLLEHFFSDSKNGWAAGYNGTILRTTDGGQSWTTQVSGTEKNLYTIYFIDTQTGWAAGYNGTILHTTDGGQTWTAQSSDSDSNLSTIYFINAQTGWITGTGGTILHTSNGGQNWFKQSSPTDVQLPSVHFVDAQTGWAVSYSGTILHTTNGGQKWTEQKSGSGVSLYAIYFIDAQTGWAAGDSGTILHTSDGGLNWNEQNSDIETSLFSIYFVDAKNGWATGINGTFLFSRDGGQQWIPQASDTSSTLNSVRFVDAQTGMASGWNGSVPRTDDGGRTWKNIAHYKRFPAPWYYLSWLLTLLLLLPALRRPQAVTQPKTSIADMMASDSPLRLGDPDPLQFSAIARSLSRFIRNENTRPPLTVAVTGPWGSGKSSLMNLLAGDLKRVGFRPVWFNVWHHQQEEHLLAALLANIRRQAIPPLFTPQFPFINIDNIVFRYRLLLRRGPRHWMMWLITLLALAISAPFVIQGFRNGGDMGQMNKLKDADTLMKFLGLLWENLRGKLDLVAFSTALATATAAFLKAVNAFGINPAKLLSSIDMEGGSAGKLESRLSFRYRFAQEFEDVTLALNPLTMVILIDDLDRCRSDRVLEILEAVNFLVTSGECIIVLGMDYEVVRQSVALEYRDLAEQIKKENPVNGDSKAERFAAEYLEKLINIQVPVPVLAADGASKVMLGESQRPQAFEHFRQNAFGLARHMAPYILVLLTIVSGYRIGDHLASPTSEVVVSASIPGVETSMPAAQSPESGSAPPRDTRNMVRQLESDTRGIPGQQYNIPWLYYLTAPLLFLLLAVCLVWLRRRDLIVKDSNEFKRALQIWASVVHHHRNTPRSIKRFLNRTRYFAMRLRDRPEAEASTAQAGRNIRGRLKNLLGIDTAADPGDEEELNEAMVVAMSAIHHFDAPLIRNSPAQFFDLVDKTDLLQQVIQTHKEFFGQWPPTEQQLAEFNALATGIEAR